MELFGDLAEQYLEFARHTRDESPCFEAWSLAVAADQEVLAWIAALPRIKQQPNLVYAAARWHGVPAPGPYDALRTALLADDGTIRATILRRRTQTNEVGRLATLTPVLGGLPGPLALLEVGTSAGLCLHPDRYDYAWPPFGTLSGSGGPVLTAAASGPVPVPERHPEVAWRGGIDLNPLDVTDDDATDWLAALVWPEQHERRDRLRAAVDVARAAPAADVVTGDLVDELPALVERVATHGTVVVFHTAVIAYLDHPRRDDFAALMADLVGSGRVRWISNEAPGVVPGLEPVGPVVPNRFVLALDGTQVAWSHGHGSDLAWL